VAWNEIRRDAQQKREWSKLNAVLIREAVDSLHYIMRLELEDRYQLLGLEGLEAIGLHEPVRLLLGTLRRMTPKTTKTPKNTKTTKTPKNTKTPRAPHDDGERPKQWARRESTCAPPSTSADSIPARVAQKCAARRDAQKREWVEQNAEALSAAFCENVQREYESLQALIQRDWVEQNAEALSAEFYRTVQREYMSRQARIQRDFDQLFKLHAEKRAREATNDPAPTIRTTRATQIIKSGAFSAFVKATRKS
jgi:hypothetical protein